MSPKQLIDLLNMHNTCSKSMHKLHFFISLNVKNIFIQSKLYPYQNIATKKAHIGVCCLIKKSSMKIHIPGQDGDFRQYTGSLANFIVQNHTYNAEMSLQLQIHSCRISNRVSSTFGCTSKIILDIIQLSFSYCLNMV